MASGLCAVVDAFFWLGNVGEETCTRQKTTPSPQTGRGSVWAQKQRLQNAIAHFEVGQAVGVFGEADFRKKLLTLSEERFCDAAGDFSTEKDDSDVCSAEEAPKVEFCIGGTEDSSAVRHGTSWREEMKMDFLV